MGIHGTNGYTMAYPVSMLTWVSLPSCTQDAWTDTKLLFFCSTKVSLGAPQ